MCQRLVAVASSYLDCTKQWTWVFDLASFVTVEASSCIHHISIRTAQESTGQDEHAAEAGMDQGQCLCAIETQQARSENR